MNSRKGWNNTFFRENPQLSHCQSCCCSQPHHWYQNQWTLSHWPDPHQARQRVVLRHMLSCHQLLWLRTRLMASCLLAVHRIKIKAFGLHILYYFFTYWFCMGATYMHIYVYVIHICIYAYMYNYVHIAIYMYIHIYYTYILYIHIMSIS